MSMGRADIKPNAPSRNTPLRYVINKLTTQTHCRMKTYDDITGSSYNIVSHIDVY